MRKAIVIASALISLLTAALIIGFLVWRLTVEKLPLPDDTTFRTLSVGLPVILISLLVLFNIKVSLLGRILGSILAYGIAFLTIYVIADEIYHIYRHYYFALEVTIELLVLGATIITILAYIRQAWRGAGRTPSEALDAYQVSILVSIGLLCALLGAWGVIWVLDNQPITDRTAAELSIAELVLRDQFEHNAAGRPEQARFYCIKISDRDPADKFQARFKDRQPPVRKWSELDMEKDIGFGVHDFRWINDRTVEVKGYCHQCSGRTYRFIRKGRFWLIK